jgi:hypothetical protein
MTGAMGDYLLGIYFIVVSISWAEGRISADAIKLIAGIVLLVLAILGISFVNRG